MSFQAGDRIKAKYMATSAGVRAPGDWFAGKIVKANADGTFNIRYDDGEGENAVFARYVKLENESKTQQVKRPSPEEPSKPRSNRAGKRRAVAQQPEPDLSGVDAGSIDAMRQAPAAKRPAPTRAPPASAAEPINVDDDDDGGGGGGGGGDDDDDVAIVDAPAIQAAAAATSASAAGGSSAEGAGARNVDGNDDDDDDIQFVGRTGELALVDFPHSREWCTTKPFVAGKETERCPNCWCYVCDTAAADCPEWSAHCHATHKSTHWQQQRAHWKAHGGKPPTVSAGAGSSAGASGSASAAPACRPGFDPLDLSSLRRWSCDAILAAVQQVYPAEEPEPAGFATGVLLRPYQKQSLAFMLHNERSTDPELEGLRHELVKNKVNEWGNSRVSHAAACRGGWLCDEVGMGKTAVVAALILANPATLKPVPDERFAKLLSDDGEQTKLKLTIIVVNNTIVQQWADELKRFAPSLRVLMFYGDGKKKTAGLAQLRDVDVLLTTPHMALPPYFLANVRAHRLVVDEAHLLGDPNSTTTQKLNYLSQYQTSLMWLVTATPISTDLRQLTNQAHLLGQWEHGLKLKEISNGIISIPWPPKLGDSNYPIWKTFTDMGRDPESIAPRRQVQNEELVERLRKLIIRHTKSQRIGGEVALALPETECSTVWLDMSDDERVMYNVHRCIQPSVASSYGNYLEQCAAQLNACSHLYQEDIVCGSDSHFDKAHAEHLELEHEFKYRGQLARHKMLGKLLAEGKLKEETEEGKTVYKYTPGNSPSYYGRVGMETAEQRRKRETFVIDDDEKGEDYARKPPTLDAPFPGGSFVAATAAFLRTHERLEVPFKLTAAEARQFKAHAALGIAAEKPETVIKYEPLTNLTKFRVLMEDLGALRASEPNFRAIVFTRHSTVQERLVKLIEAATKPGGVLAPGTGTSSASKLVVFEFNAKTAPQQRHRLIQQFQDPARLGARVFVVTYATAAVGITLTAANRIFLMEPCIDPGQEVQAAGRIHRLGQEKDCFIKRYAFRDSIEEAVVALHEKIKAKEIAVVDGRVDQSASRAALDAFMRDKVTHSFTGVQRERKEKQQGSRHDSGIPTALEEWWQSIHPVEWWDKRRDYRYSSSIDPGQTKSRQQLYGEVEKAFKEENGYEVACKQAACVFCGSYKDLPGTFSWTGTGCYAYLAGDRRDPPDRAQRREITLNYESQWVHEVPRPPNGWLGLPVKHTDNGCELPANTGAATAASDKGKGRGKSKAT